MNASNKYKNVSLPKITILYSEQQVLQTFFVYSKSIKFALLQHEPESFGILWEQSFNNERM